MRRRQVVDEPVPGMTTTEVLHSGDTSVIYRARREGSETPVVVKLLRSHTSGGRRDEVELWRTLSTHQGILSILDTGHTAAGLPYLVLEDCPSGSLADELCANGPLPVPEVLRVGVAVAHGLRAVHAHDMLHHAVSPDNIVNARFGPALIDFGRTLPSWDPFPPVGHTRRTLLHAPPEELLGERPTPASDLYRLASSLWTLLAGFPPFDDGPDPLPVEQYRERLLTRPARRVPREDVPDWLQATLRHALCTDPNLRPATADELIAMLRREREPEPPEEETPAATPSAPAAAPVPEAAPPEAEAEERPVPGTAEPPGPERDSARSDPGSADPAAPAAERPMRPQASVNASASRATPVVGPAGGTVAGSSVSPAGEPPVGPPAASSASAPAIPAASSSVAAGPATPEREETTATGDAAASSEGTPPTKPSRLPPRGGPGWTGPGWSEPSERPRSRGLHLALLLGGAAVVLFGVGAIGLFAIELLGGGEPTTSAEEPSEPAENAPEAAEGAFEPPDDLPVEPQPEDAVEGAELAPTGVELRDGTITAALSWTDNSDGAVHYVVGGPVDADASTMADAPPSATAVEVTGLNPDLEYCFRVVAVVSADVLAPSEEVCTDRAPTTNDGET